MRTRITRGSVHRDTAGKESGSTPRANFSENSERRNNSSSTFRHTEHSRSSFGSDRRREGGRPSFGGDRRSEGGRPSFGGDRRREGGRPSFGGDRRSEGGRPSFGGDRRREGGRPSFGGDRRSEGGRPSFGGDRRREGGRPSFGGDRRREGGRPSFGGDRRREGGRPSFGGDRRREGGRPSFGGSSYNKSNEQRRNDSTKFGRNEGSIAIANDGLIRLNKFIANSGVCSRREADEYISAGLVTVNGTVVDQLGSKVKSTDDIRFNGERLKGEEKVYVVMNKPKNYVTTMSDPHADKNVMDLITKDKCRERIYPVGRLDKATTGVLLFTNDGELAEQLSHPSHLKKKIYQATLDKNLKTTDFNTLLEGFELEDGFIAADAMSYLDGEKNKVGIEIHSGKNRIIRRLFEHLGYKVKSLDRVYFAGLTKKNISRGQWRFLSEDEVNHLKMGAYE